MLKYIVEVILNEWVNEWMKKFMSNEGNTCLGLINLEKNNYYKLSEVACKVVEMGY